MKHLHDLKQDELDQIWSPGYSTQLYAQEKVDGTSIEYRIETKQLRAVKSRNGKWCEPLDIPSEHWNNDIRAAAAFIDEALKWIDIDDGLYEGHAEIVRGRGQHISQYEEYVPDQFVISFTGFNPDNKFLNLIRGRIIAATIPSVSYNEDIEKVESTSTATCFFTKPRHLNLNTQALIDSTIGPRPSPFPQADLNINKCRSSADIIRAARESRTMLLTQVGSNILTRKNIGTMADGVMHPEGIVIYSGANIRDLKPIAKVVYKDWLRRHHSREHKFKLARVWMCLHDVVVQKDDHSEALEQEWRYQEWKHRNGR